MYSIKSLLTKDNITLALSIFGSIGTLLSWLFSITKNRKNIDIKIAGRRFSNNTNFLLVYMLFENRSSLPISITDISVQLDSTWYPCEKVPIVALTETSRHNGEITSQHEHYTLPFPIFITGLGGTSGYVYFEFPESSLPLDATHLKFLVSTNRGKAIEKKLSLGRQLD